MVVESWQWAMAVLAGAVGQFIDTAAGMGFGALAGTVMLAGGVAPAVVVGTVSIAKIGSGAISGFAHWKLNNVRMRWVLLIAGPGMLGGVLSASLLTSLPVEAIRIWVPVVLLIMGLLLLRRFTLRSGGLPKMGGASDEGVAAGRRGILPAVAVPTVPLGLSLAAIGFVAGFANGLSGAFGPVATTGVALRVKGHPRYAIGSVNVAEVLVALAVSMTIVARIPWEAIGWQMPLALMAGSLITAPVGAYLASHLPSRVVGTGLALVLLGLNGASLVRAFA